MASLKTTRLARNLQLLVRTALLVLFLGQLLTGGVRGAEDASNPYDTLYDVIMTRYGPDGKSYAQNDTTPSILAGLNSRSTTRHSRSSTPHCLPFRRFHRKGSSSTAMSNARCCSSICGKSLIRPSTGTGRKTGTGAGAGHSRKLTWNAAQRSSPQSHH